MPPVDVRRLSIHFALLPSGVPCLWVERAEPLPVESPAAGALARWPRLATDEERLAALASWGGAKLAARATPRAVVGWLPSDGEEALASRFEWRGRSGGATTELAAARLDALELPWRIAVDLLVLFTQEDETEPDLAHDAPSDELAAVDAAPRAHLAPDARAFVHALRFAARLALAGRFVPGVVRDEAGVRACWTPALRDEEHAILAAFAVALPGSARSIAPLAEGVAPDAPPSADARALLDRFVSSAVDMIVRMGANEARQIGSLGLSGRIRSQHDAWTRALLIFDSRLSIQESEGDPIEREIAAWQQPLELSSGAPFRLALRLDEPEGDATAWTLRLLLRATDDPSLFFPVSEAFSPRPRSPRLLPRPGFAPRELALVALGQASGVSPLLSKLLGSEPRDALSLTLDQAWQFLTKDAVALEQAGFAVLLPKFWQRRPGRQPLTARGRLRAPSTSAGELSLDQIVTVDWEIALGDQALSPAEIQQLAKMKQPLVKLRGQWVELDAEQLAGALERWRRQPTTTAKVRDLVHLALGIDGGAAPLPVEAIEGGGLLGELFAGLANKESFQELPTPGSFVGELRPYQRRGWSWLKFLRRFGLPSCLADDMGLGKTIQALALLADEQAAGETRPTLLVCPTSLVGNWQREAARFTPGLKVMVHHGLERSRDAEFAAAARQHALVVTTYSLLSRDVEALASVQWAGVLLDEAQNVKNPDTKQARAARRLPAEWRIVMTGTPVENHVGDLWSLFQFLNPDLLPPREAFHREFLMPIRVGRDEAALARLKRRTGPFILRRLKSDPAILPDLPSKLEHKVVCSLTREQATLYAAIVNEMTDKARATSGMERRGAILAGLTKLKQVCNHPAHLLGDGSALPGRSGKLARATEMLDEIVDVGDRALVFTQFREMGDLLQRHFSLELGREVAFLHGGTPRAKRQELVDRFQEDAEGPPIFILSLKAGGTGLNLTRAAHVFHFDRWWNPAVEAQATDRAHRIGQTRQLQVHLLVCAGTLEERIDAMLAKKREVAERVVGSGEQWLTELSTEQLRELVELDSEAVAE